MLPQNSHHLPMALSDSSCPLNPIQFLSKPYALKGLWVDAASSPQNGSQGLGKGSKEEKELLAPVSLLKHALA